MIRFLRRFAARRLRYRCHAPSPPPETPSHRAIMTRLDEVRAAIPKRSHIRDVIIIWATWITIWGLPLTILGLIISIDTTYDLDKALEHLDTIVVSLKSATDSLNTTLFISHRLLDKAVQPTAMGSPAGGDQAGIENIPPLIDRTPKMEMIDSAQAALDKGNYPKAEALYRRLVQSNADIGYFLVNLGYACYKQKKYPDAVSSWQRALEADTTNAIPAYNLGIYYLSNRKFDKAETEFRKTLNRDRYLCDAYFNLGRVLILQGKNAEADTTFNDATACDQELQKDIDDFINTI